MLLPEHCERCNIKAGAMIMSMFNTDWICLECKDAEKRRPDYNEAVAKDLMELADRVGGPQGESIRKNARNLLQESTRGEG